MSIERTPEDIERFHSDMARIAANRQYREAIWWIPVERELPDDEATVLVYAPHEDDPVWIGFLDGGYWHWRGSFSGRWGARLIQSPVTHWAHLPKGPQ